MNADVVVADPLFEEVDIEKEELSVTSSQEELARIKSEENIYKKAKLKAERAKKRGLTDVADGEDAQFSYGDYKPHGDNDTAG